MLQANMCDERKAGMARIVVSTLREGVLVGALYSVICENGNKDNAIENISLQK